MVHSKPVVLAVDDEKDILETIKAVLKGSCTVEVCSDPKAALIKFGASSFDVVLVDIRMPSMDGISFLKKAKQIRGDSEFIVITALSDAKTATSAMKEGAYDYISKPFDSAELKLLVLKAYEKKMLASRDRAFSQMSSREYQNMIGASPQMEAVFSSIETVAAADSPVLITGETGCGKELIAKAIHKRSRRANKAFVALNCAAVPENLFESELFGHERGSFTGALERHIGKFELSDGGTLFLDEIGCLSLAMQAKLLRALQEGEITRVGGREVVGVDIRLVTATNSQITAMIQEGTFRLDLYYRINVIPITDPPLRERKDDVGLLAAHFLCSLNKKTGKNIRAFSREVMDMLRAYYWPGNVRELQNVVERLVVLSKTDIIDKNDLPSEIRLNVIGSKMPLEKACSGFEQDCIRRALDHFGGNQSKAARFLEVDRTTLISKMKKYSMA